MTHAYASSLARCNFPLFTFWLSSFTQRSRAAAFQLLHGSSNGTSINDAFDQGVWAVSVAEYSSAAEYVSHKELS